MVQELQKSERQRSQTKKERPIIFGPESIRQILNGSKSQTRRVVKPQPAADWIPSPWPGDSAAFADLRCPYGAVGDRIWVKEAFICVGDDLWSSWVEYTDGSAQRLMKSSSDLPGWWKSSKRQSPLFMPRWASRITLELTEVRVERLTDISEEDAVAEGCTATQLSPFISADEHETARDQYQRVWDELNARRGYPWQDSLWVWVLSFKLLAPERS